MQNPSGDSTSITTNSSPSSPDQTPPPPYDTTQTAAGDVTAATEGGSVMAGVTVTDSDATIFPSQVVDVDLTSGGDGSPVRAAVGEGGGSSAVAVMVEGGSTAERRGKQKRKPSQLSDLPPGPPKCSECGKEFPSWKSAFGHMRAHPNRHYRGFFKPPAFSSPSPTRQRIRKQVAGENTNTGDQEQEQGGGRVLFDLNQPTEEEVEVRSSSEAADRHEAPEASSSDAGKSAEEGKKIGFDLNELPPPEDDGEHKS